MGRKIRRVGSFTINVKRTPKRVLKVLGVQPEHWRPRHRADCRSVKRPCPYVSCKHNLYLDVMENGNIKINFAKGGPEALPPGGSCVLDITERIGPLNETETGRALNMTYEGVRRIQKRIERKLGRPVFWRKDGDDDGEDTNDVQG